MCGEFHKVLFFFFSPLPLCTGLPWWLSGKESACQCRRHRRLGFYPWVGKIPWRRKWQLPPAFLPGKSQGQRNLVGHSPWACKSVRCHRARTNALCIKTSLNIIYYITSYCFASEHYNPYFWIVP